MSVIVVGGEKGGVGKTTLSLQFAALLAAYKRRVIILDTDSEPSALAWLGERPEHLPRIEGRFEPHHVGTRAELLALGFDDVVIDAGAGDTEVLRSGLEVADLLISPFKPSQLDVWKARKVADRIARVRRETNPGLRAFACVNCASPLQARQEEARDALALLRHFEAWTVADTVVYDRKAFVTTGALGLAVHELGRRGNQAADEVWSLVEEMGILGEPEA
jgi:chromosome partitioning protein